LLALLASTLVQGIVPGTPALVPLQNDHRCFLEKPIESCKNTSAIQDTCCSPTPGGLVLQTQFWDTYTGLESQGQLLPDDRTWTIHGLWPDFCDGSFTQYCDLSRQYDPNPSPNVTDGHAVLPYNGPGVDIFIKKFGRDDLLDFMNKYWINQGDTNAHFWAHEFSKHATCFSTYDTKCYKPYVEHEDVIDFFESVIRAWEQFPTGDFLRSHGIVPSNTTTYTLEQMQDAVKAHTGVIPYFGCTGPEAPEGDGRTVVDEVWHFNHALGTTQSGKLIHVDSTTPSSCTSKGKIWYYERTPSSVRHK